MSQPAGPAFFVGKKGTPRKENKQVYTGCHINQEFLDKIWGYAMLQYEWRSLEGQGLGKNDENLVRRSHFFVRFQKQIPFLHFLGSGEWTTSTVEKNSEQDLYQSW